MLLATALFKSCQQKLAYVNDQRSVHHHLGHSSTGRLCKSDLFISLSLILIQTFTAYNNCFLDKTSCITTGDFGATCATLDNKNMPLQPQRAFLSLELILTKQLQAFFSHPTTPHQTIIYSKIKKKKKSLVSWKSHWFRRVILAGWF